MDHATRYVLRGAVPDDEEGLLRVAKFLNSVNLPDDRGAVRALLEASAESFSGRRQDPASRQYVFVVEDQSQQQIIGTSMIIAQKGRREAPYIYYSVKKDERYSPHLDRHFVHQVLELGFSYAGPTELGGLVMDPNYRRAPEKLGMLISYIRFLWIAMHRAGFQDQLLAELMPPLQPDGTSHLWEAVGRHFTGLTYQEADKLSKYNKEFIRRLFPSANTYTALLSEDAQSVIGQVGKQTKGVEKLLRRIGFQYATRVDPFDGGPHFMADTGKVTLIAAAKPVSLQPWGANSDAPPDEASARWLLATALPKAPWLTACAAQVRPGADAVGWVSPEVCGLFGGNVVWGLPLRPPLAR